eukprot:14016216-Alexandrium_andersonii.AAC.1
MSSRKCAAACKGACSSVHQQLKPTPRNSLRQLARAFDGLQQFAAACGSVPGPRRGRRPSSAPRALQGGT